MAEPQKITDFLVNLDRRFAAPRERVWRAWTDPAEVRAWWGGKSYATESVDMDVRVGGTFRIVILGEERKHIVGGTYLEVVPPERLVHSWAWEGGDWAGHEMRVTIEFKEDGDGTHMLLTHENLPDQNACDLHTGGWTHQLDAFTEYLEEA